MGAFRNPITQILKKVLNWANYDLTKKNLPSNLPSDFSDFERQTVIEVRPYTMTSPERIVSLIRAVEYLVAHNITGPMVECGVWKGGSMMAVAKTLLHLKKTDYPLYLFDTFEGMSEPTEFDKSITGITAKEVLTQDKDWCYAGLEEVKSALGSTGYPRDKLFFIKGKVEDTLPSFSASGFSLLRLDTDFYESTKTELEHLYPKLQSKGVLIIDDFGEWKGVRKACEEFFAERATAPFLNRIDFSAHLAIKA